LVDKKKEPSTRQLRRNDSLTKREKPESLPRSDADHDDDDSKEDLAPRPIRRKSGQRNKIRRRHTVGGTRDLTADPRQRADERLLCQRLLAAWCQQQKLDGDAAQPRGCGASSPDIQRLLMMMAAGGFKADSDGDNVYSEEDDEDLLGVARRRSLQEVPASAGASPSLLESQV
jgi:hypothetical protein